jgi:hypothetical protein
VVLRGGKMTLAGISWGKKVITQKIYYNLLKICPGSLHGGFVVKKAVRRKRIQLSCARQKAIKELFARLLSFGNIINQLLSMSYLFDSTVELTF